MERRSAARHPLPTPLSAMAGTVPVSIIEISSSGCRVEHEERIQVGATLRLRFTTNQPIAIPSKVVRSILAGRRGAQLIYQTGLEFSELEPEVSELLDGVVQEVEQVEPKPVAPISSASPLLSSTAPATASAAGAPVERAFMRCTLADSSWTREFVESDAQPENGFTVSVPGYEALDAQQRVRVLAEVKILCNAFAVADPETRRMMRNALGARVVRP